ncbi:MAG: PUA domain-containing protein [Pyrodictiaceae archaeon]
MKPPSRYYFRVNTLRIDPGSLLDELRGEGYTIFRDEEIEEALWAPIEGPFELPRDVDCKVVVDKRTAESVLLGANVYKPGIVAVDKCLKPGREVIVVSENGIEVAYGVSRISWNEIKGKGLAVEIIVSRFKSISLRDTKYHREGLIYEQSLPSMYVAHVLSPEKGSTIVDMCAAPGGKTSHVLELIGGRATVIAVDHSKSKLDRMKREIKRLGHERIVRLVKADSRYLDKDYPWLKADYVILDPPCTALGVIPKIYDKKSLRDVKSLSEYQRQFLRTASRILKPCGILVYSTCTLTIEENERNIIYAVEELGFELEDAYPRRGSRGIGMSEAQRFHPHVHSTPGYFIARLRRKC